MEECEGSSNRKRGACRKPRREMHRVEEEEAEEESGGRNETDLEDFVTRAQAVNTIRSQSKKKKP